MTKRSKTIVKYLVEFLVVAFGVFLGVFVIEWNTQNKTDQNTKRTLAFIIDEIDSNIEKLDHTTKYQTVLVSSADSITALLDEEVMKETFYNNDNFRLSYLPNW